MISLASTPARPARLSRSARLGLPIAALVTMLCGSTAVAAHAAAPASPAKASSAFTWHNFTLKNGWKTAGTKKLITGHPGWSIHNNVVYLRGAIKQTGGNTESQFATLPKGDRPAHNLYIQVFTQNATPGTLFISTSGVLEAYDGNALAHTSLGGVSFPTAAIKGHALPLTNGWTSSQSQFNSGDPSYAISKGVVYLSGSLHGGSAGTTAFTIPNGIRPAHLVYLAIYTDDSGLGGTLVLHPDGQAEIFGSQASGYTSLANISFPAPGVTWHKFSLIDGWKSAQTAYNTGAPAYTVIDGVRYLSGSLITSTATNGLWTRLPAVTRTPTVVQIEVYTVASTTGGLAVTNSLGLVGSNPFSDAQEFTSLGGVAYPPGA